MGIDLAVHDKIARPGPEPVDHQRLVHEQETREILAGQDSRRPGIGEFLGRPAGAVLVPADAFGGVLHEQVLDAGSAEISEPGLHAGRHRLAGRIAQRTGWLQVGDVILLRAAEPDDGRIGRPVDAERVAGIGRLGADEIEHPVAVHVHDHGIGSGDRFAVGRGDLDARIEPRLLARAHVLVEVKPAGRRLGKLGFRCRRLVLETADDQVFEAVAVPVDDGHGEHLAREDPAVPVHALRRVGAAGIFLDHLRAAGEVGGRRREVPVVGTIPGAGVVNQAKLAVEHQQVPEAVVIEIAHGLVLHEIHAVGHGLREVDRIPEAVAEPGMCPGPLVHVDKGSVHRVGRHVQVKLAVVVPVDEVEAGIADEFGAGQSLAE